MEHNALIPIGPEIAFANNQYITVTDQVNHLTNNNYNFHPKHLELTL